MADHEHLGDDELAARLTARNVATVDAAWLIEHRDDLDAAAAITRILEGAPA